ncbi:MAG TPA: elongation factor Ts [Flavobacteriales bacterium]|nr:elongation factor Ts [Flavobacteriales bacterium]|tara:strand:- start:33558 stop:34385 length:828 start_codon:yes stop_codon:yes gene_type:complete
MKITASEVNKLRQQTGAGMMDCKKALEEAQGDFEAAVDILRLKGQKVAAKRGDRDATEGLAIAKTNDNGKKAVAIILNCETDFVANNAAFGEVANNILTVAINESPASLEELKSKTFPGSDLSIEDKLTEEIGKIGEKIELSYYETVEGESVVAYNHPGNNLASIVSFNKPAGEDITRDVAMQVAAMAPVAVNEDSIPAEVIAKELEIGKELAIQEGKPAEMADKIAQGRLKKFFKESTLLNQAFIKDNKLSIATYLQQKEDGLTVTEFKRASLN